eukprot:TRINITY_DN12229_c0_g5_i1.p1 TRINITY_DN12229_c0_g5~~TRINITY_DN12229_c0_g5_i1.p1  ORF type:complete len:277 (+),score=71.53 TRINITY_DN12229_c0_g5_i1:95-832(+)
MFKNTVIRFGIPTLKQHPQKFLFLGAPGVGKGTYSARLCRDAGYAHVSTGDLLRTEVAEGTVVGREAKSYMDKGDLVPSGLVDEMVKVKIDALTKQKRGFVLDGYPRNVEQAKIVSEFVDLDFVINLAQPFDVIENKISGRRSCSECGEGYNTSTVTMGSITMEPLLPAQEGVCDACKKPMDLLQRADDHIDVVRHRLDVYSEVTKPVEEFYSEIMHTFDVLGSTKIYYPKFLEFLKTHITAKHA